jgi:NADPH:quinone reductase-like Zn-dependent oxidoreductase
MDFAGTIEQVGAAMRAVDASFRVGDRVLGHQDPLPHHGQHGALAELVVMPVPPAREHGA